MPLPVCASSTLRTKIVPSTCPLIRHPSILSAVIDASANVMALVLRYSKCSFVCQSSAVPSHALLAKPPLPSPTSERPQTHRVWACITCISSPSFGSNERISPNFPVRYTLSVKRSACSASTAAAN